MIGKRLALAGLFLVLAPWAAWADPWVQVNTAGFGVAGSSEADRGTGFTDPADGFFYAYFGTKNLGVGAGVFRSSDGVSWNQVNASGFDLPPSVASTIWISTYNNGTVGALFAGTGVTGGVGARVYRSLGGAAASQWKLVFSSVTTGNASSLGMPGYPSPFNGAFYMGTENRVSGGEVWKSTSADSASAWIQVSTGGFGQGVNNATMSYFKVFGGNLFVATNSSSAAHGQIWRSTGTVTTTQSDVFAQVLVASNTFSTTTFSVSTLESFNGFFYAGTLNSNGAQLWRTATPSAGPWTQLFSPDGDAVSRFSVVLSSEIHALSVINGILYAATWDQSGTDGTRVYRSTDGVNFTRSNPPGFGIATNQYVGGFVPFGNFALASVRNDTAVQASVYSSTAVIPAAPALSAAALGISSITWSWPGVAVSTGFRLISPTFVNISGDLPAGTTFFTETGLAANTSFTRSLVVFNSIGASTSAAVSRFTLAAPPAGSAFTSVYGSSIALAWGANGNPAGTTFEVDSFQAGGSTTATTYTVTKATLTSLIGLTSYYISIRAINGEGLFSAFDVQLATFTNNVTINIATITAGAPALLAVNTPAGVLKLIVPPGAFPQTVQLTFSVPGGGVIPPTTASYAANLTPSPTALGIQVDLSPLLEPVKPVTLILPYLAPDAAGLDQTKLVLARYDPIQNVWVPLVSTPDPTNKNVTALTAHLSLFQLMQASPSTTLSTAKAFPNPLQPALGQTAMVFSNLPANARVRIYTLSGELVRDLLANSSGLASWDGNNMSGNKAASGVYFVLAQAKGDKRVLKVAIER